MKNIQEGTGLVPSLVPDRIIGGQPATDCQWPTVVDMSICSGVLVHPRVVVYAGHCGPQGEVKFGNGTEGFTISIDYEDCEVHPLWTIAGNDIAFCELPVEVTDLPFVHMLGVTEPLPAPGEMVTIVGYGATEDGATGGFKNFGQATYLDFNVNDGELRIGGNGVDACSGDSGGPAMAEQADGTWRIIGLTSQAEDGTEPCGGISRYTYAPAAVAWVEETSGFDISPCFDGAVAMDCEPSDAAAEEPDPVWCEWGSALDDTGSESSGGGMGLDSTGGETEESSESSSAGTEAVPDDGCSCRSNSGDGSGLAAMLTVYLFARMASSYAAP